MRLPIEYVDKNGNVFYDTFSDGYGNIYHYKEEGVTGILSIEVKSSTLEIPEGINYISSCIFEPGKENEVKTIIFPDSLKRISSNNFDKMQNLEDIRFSAQSNLVAIDMFSFTSCPKLKFVMLPSSIKDIGMYTFLGQTPKDVKFLFLGTTDQLKELINSVKYLASFFKDTLFTLDTAPLDVLLDSGTSLSKINKIIKSTDNLEK